MIKKSENLKKWYFIDLFGFGFSGLGNTNPDESYQKMTSKCAFSLEKLGSDPPRLGSIATR
uniref:Uncharacterized protein n=1 Tax=Candidatus Kentrum sp. UNK TaxID=2126344 RepID=A0A451AS51_9GAMM|nr:MAG: hypothetical protein BECKUNK1418G_GA0071005_12792 [Candidatus Kentron sp. UNK]VFK73741.1 MAG: hypothetical protein BECKUNK1418H_GA0071006_12702 [Candidatus Kentron sp. UNK]